MKSAFATLDRLLLSPAFPMWVTVAAAGLFAIILLLTLARAEKSVANGALTVITLLAIGIAVAATFRGFGPLGSSLSRDAEPSPQINVALPALFCVDDLAGESVETACEKALFGSAESAAAAVSYAAGRLGRLLAFGNVATANRNMTPELSSLRRSIERDRYGLIAYVLVSRDRCRPTDCPAFQSLTDRDQIAANMVNQTYDGLISRYAPSWNAPAPAPTTVAALPQPIPGAPAATAAALPPLSPGATGKPTTADFPSAASIPPVSIMTPEPTGSQTASAPRSPPSTANAQLLSPQPVTTSAPSALKKPAAKTRAQTPVQLAPAAPKADN
jgi:hypothetical protein